jgi:translation initiation factor eIF-2B subunit epsilon
MCADAITARSAVVGRGCVLGAGTTLGDNCKVASSTIGKNCTLGAGVTVKNSHIWDNVVIEDGAVLEHCIVCEGARIKRGATVSAGCVISYNVVIGEGATLPKHTRVSMFPTDDEEELKRLSGAPFDTDLVGPDGKGYRWRGETGADFDYVAEPEQAEELGVNMDRARLAACTAEEEWKTQLWSKVPEPQEEEAR